MRPRATPGTGRASAELSALIDTLHETGQRLEALTGKQVDGVVDAEGRTFLLQHAQEHLRNTEAGREARILDALPAHIALVDPQGYIVSVNEAWRHFSSADAPYGAGHQVGTNYLAACDRTQGVDANDASRVATGLRGVLSGAQSTFSMEYACHSPEARRWFLLNVSPLAGAPPSGAVVTHLDITVRRRASDELRRSESLKSSILEASPDCLITVDHEGRIVEFNPAAEAVFGFARAGALGRTMSDMIIPPRYREAHRKGFARYLATGEGKVLGRRIEIEAIRANGAEFPIELTITAIAADPTPRFTAFIRDITARKETDRKLKRLNRVHAVLSGINSLIVRLPGREELLAEACRIAVEHGALRMAWIGLVDETDGLVRPVASAGEVGDFFASAPREVTESRPGGFGLAGRAIAEMRPLVSNDVASDPAVVMKAAFAARGIHSLAVIPLVVGSGSIGILSLNSADAGFFDAEELRLLVEVAGNISLALEHMAKAEKLERLTRVNAMLSDINGAIVRIRDRHALFAEACRIAVQTGGLGFAWICTVDEAAQRCRPVVWAGGDGDDYAGILRDRLSLRDGAAEGHGISAKAIRERSAFVVNDVEADATLRDRPAFAGGGLKSLASLPMFVGGRAIGAFTLHAAESGFFDQDEMQLLHEVAGNIAFAIEHIEKEDRVRRLTRVHAVLSGINSLIVRAVDRDELFREAARIAVDHGGFRMVSIAILEPDGTTLRPIASAGDVRDFPWPSGAGSAGDQPGGGLTGRAIREMRPMVSNDIASDPGIAAKHELQDRGIESAALIPLIVGAKAYGVLELYSSEAGFFDDDEVRLLSDLGGDLSHAIDHLDKQARLEYLAYYDVLTGLPNRSLFLGRVAQGMRDATSRGHKLALFFIDLERFKNINDALGRAVGDALLRQVAEWLTRKGGDADVVAHLGADLFAVVLPNVKRESAVARLLEKSIKAFLEHPFSLNGGTFRIAAKVGVAVFPHDGTNADTLFKHAEAALKKAKASGDRYLFYRPTMTESVAGKLTLENQLRQALDRGEFVLHYQPKVSLASGKLTGAEALIRWNDPRTGLVPPGRFIPVLEETGLIHEVGRWALRQALADYLRWRAAGLPAVRIAVNVSPLQLRGRGFVAEIRAAVGVDTQAPGGLELEITESLIMEEVKRSITTLQEIRALGVTVAIDDFGTGFSSLSYLAKLPVDTLKVDRSFVVDMTAGPEGLALVSTIINLAHSLKLRVVAEGVETDEQSRLLRLLDCDEMQGFLFSKPVPCDAFEAAFLAPPPAA